MADITRVSAADAQKLLGEGYTYVDVRSEPEFAAGHPAGAYNVPLMHMGGGGMTPNPRFVEVMRARFPLSSKLVLGCKGGNRSLRAANMLLGEGYASVVDQRAGWDGARDAFGAVTEPGWSASGLAVENGEPEGRSYVALAK